MDPSRFTDQKTGRLLRVDTASGPDWAFVPESLPPNWELPKRLLNDLVSAWDCLGNLNGIGRTLPNPELLLRPLQDREALQSSKLEGTYATPEQVLLFAKNPSIPKSETDPANVWKEVYNYKIALLSGLSYLNERGFTINLIRQMHETLMTGVRGREKTPGEFRKVQVAIGSDHRFIPPPSQLLLGLLGDLEQYMNNDEEKLQRLTKAFFVHYQFETIHPFMDGNGRIGRVLLALMLFRLCGHEKPWLYLSPFFERYRDEYVTNLFHVSTHGDWTSWIEFCLRGTIESARDAIKRCRMLSLLRASYRERVQNTASPRTLRIVEMLFEDPSIRIIDIQKKCDVAYKTAKADMIVLHEAGILRRLDGYYPACFYAWEIFRIAYHDIPAISSDDEIKDEIDSAAATPLSIEPSSQS